MGLAITIDVPDRRDVAEPNHAWNPEKIPDTLRPVVLNRGSIQRDPSDVRARPRPRGKGFSPMPQQRQIFPSGFENVFARFPLTLVDIGVSGGIQDRWASMLGRMKAVGFEPDRRACEALSGHDEFLIINSGVWEAAGTIDFHLTRNGVNSSAFPANRKLLDRFLDTSHYFDVVNTVKVSVDSLDNLLQRHSIDDIDFIKIDTQGSELKILQGATRTVGHCAFGLEVEVYFAEAHIGMPLFHDIDAFLAGRGYHTFDIAQKFWKRRAGALVGGEKGQLGYADVLYFMNETTFRDALSKISDPEARQAKVIKAITCCMAYGYVDYAIDILELAKDVMTSGQFDQADGFLRGRTMLKASLPRLRGQDRLSSIFGKLAAWMRPYRNSPDDECLGNRLV